MTALMLAAAIACLTPQGERMTLVRPIHFEEVQAYELPAATQWCAFALEGDRILWPSGQSVQVQLKSGRVVRARTLMVNWKDSMATQRLGGKMVILESSQLSGATSRRTGKWGTFVAAGFDQSFPLDSVLAVQVGNSAAPQGTD